MVIYKEDIKLNEVFPFRIDRYLLNRNSNKKDSFHYHHFCEITFIENGHGYYHVNGCQYEMNVGDLIIFNNVEPHGWTVVSENMQVLVIVFAPELVADPVNALSDEYLEPFLERGSNFENRVEAIDGKKIYEIMQEIFVENIHKEHGFQNVIRIDILRILMHLIRHYQQGDIGKEENLLEKKRSMKRLEQAFFYINAHYTENVTLENVSSLVYMSPNYFSSYFKKITNKTFSEYITLLRLKKVKELYQTTDLSVANIALECGFRNMSNFYRLYKKHLGELPKRKRK